MTNPLLHLSIPSFAYGKRLILQDIDISVPQEQWICLWGPSGVGKTTLLKIILQQYASTIPLAYVGQDDNLLPWATVLENVLLGYSLRHQRHSDLKRQALSLLEKVDLHNFSEAYPCHLSAGMAQRVALVRVILEKPLLVLLDEPFSNLDQKIKQNVLSLLRTTLKKSTFLWITHDFEEAFSLSHHIWVLEGCPASLKENLTPLAFKEKIVAPLEKRLS